MAATRKGHTASQQRGLEDSGAEAMGMGWTGATCAGEGGGKRLLRDRKAMQAWSVGEEEMVEVGEKRASTVPCRLRSEYALYPAVDSP